MSRYVTYLSQGLWTVGAGALDGRGEPGEADLVGGGQPGHPTREPDGG